VNSKLSRAAISKAVIEVGGGAGGEVGSVVGDGVEVGVACTWGVFVTCGALACGMAGEDVEQLARTSAMRRREIHAKLTCLRLIFIISALYIDACLFLYRKIIINFVGSRSFNERMQ